MTDTFRLLSDGLSQLCHAAPAVDGLIAPHRETIVSRLSAYITAIELQNPALGLVGTNDREELIIRHILDSLSPLDILMRWAYQGTGRLPIADVGSGAGLPGIPLAIVMPDKEFILIERKRRRAIFLRQIISALNLSHVTVEEAEMEKTPPGRFALVSFRAFKPLEPKMFKKLFRLRGADGCLAAYKGRREKIEAEMAALEKALPYIAGHWEITPCPVPFLDEQRHLLTIY